MKSQINFSKMHVNGNDFVIIANFKNQVAYDPEFIKKIANRHFGVGCDQCLFIELTNDPSVFFYKIFNQDGSEVGQCGNGARAVTLWLKKNNYIKNRCILKTITTTINAFIAPDDTISISTKIISNPVITSYKIDNISKNFFVLDLGNPHAVCIEESLDPVVLESWGVYLNSHPDFPYGTNVEFIKIINNNTINLQVYERGVGLTSSCGSGAIAAVVSGVFAGIIENEVTVMQPGGASIVKWNKNTDPTISGKADLVFEGILSTIIDK